MPTEEKFWCEKGFCDNFVEREEENGVDLGARRAAGQ